MMREASIDEVVARLRLAPGVYVATSTGDDTNRVIISNHTTGSVVGVATTLTDAAAWCRAFNARRLGSGWWAGRVVNGTNKEDEGNER